MSKASGRHGAQERVRRGSVYAVLGAVLCFAVPAAAQDAQQRQSAADAYDRGSAAYLAEDYEAAARWFETANRLAPAAPALLQAIRAHRLAGDDARSATLALKMIAEYEGAAAEEAQAVVDALAPGLFRVNVACAGGCAVTVDDSLAPHTSFFVNPDETHRIELGFATGDVEREVEGAAGEETLLEAEAPPRVEGSQLIHRDDGRTTRPTPPDEGGGLSPALFITSLVLTVGAGATLVWSGIDVINDNDEYEQAVADGDIARARTLLANGQKEETRTNALIGVTAGLGALTLVFAILTDWDGTDEAAEDQAQGRGVRSLSVRPTASVSGRHGALGLAGAF